MASNLTQVYSKTSGVNIDLPYTFSLLLVCNWSKWRCHTTQTRQHTLVWFLLLVLHSHTSNITSMHSQTDHTHTQTYQIWSYVKISSRLGTRSTCECTSDPRGPRVPFQARCKLCWVVNTPTFDPWSISKHTIRKSPPQVVRWEEEKLIFTYFVYLHTFTLLVYFEISKRNTLILIDLLLV